MSKGPQIEALVRAGFHYSTAITKPQVERLLKANVLQLALFTAQVREVEHEGTRYLARRNPLRAESKRPPSWMGAMCSRPTCRRPWQGQTSSRHGIRT